MTAPPITVRTYPECLNELTPSLSALVQDAVPVMQRIMLLKQAHHSFFIVPQLTGQPNYTHSEAIYDALYQDIHKHPNYWFDGVFAKNRMYAEWTVGILGTLATMRRQRGQVQDCLDILQVDAQVLQVYQDLIQEQATDPEELECCLILTYKYHVININANAQLGNSQVAVDSFRKVIPVELEHPNHSQVMGWIHLLEPFFENVENITAAQVEELSDEQIWFQIKLYTDEPNQPGGNIHFDLRICDYCGDTETMLGNYKCCSACKVTRYCSKECQRAHWTQGGHKHSCGHVDCEIDHEEIKGTAVILTKNYSQTVYNFTKTPVNEANTKKVVPKLVNWLYDAIKTQPELNSPSAFTDAGSDAVFNSKIDAFFEQQDGFEALVKIHKTPEARVQKERLYSKNKVQVDENTLVAAVKTIVGLFASSFVNDVDESHHDLLMDVGLVALHKIMLENPKYNSYSGLNKIADDGESMKYILMKMGAAMANENPDAWLDQEAETKELQVLVDEEEMMKLADAAIETIVIMLRRLGKLDREPKRDFARDVVLLLMKEHVSTRPEFNSNDTVQNLIDDMGFKNKMLELTVNLL